MSTPKIRLHGNVRLHDPSLVKKMCPKCSQVRVWIITRTKEGYTKKCSKCGIVIRVKRPKIAIKKT